MPNFSLVYLTYRPGGIDLLTLSLMSQPPIYELIVIDGLPGRSERGEALKYLQAHGIPVKYYGPPKDKSYPDTKVNLANAMNTGASVASSAWIVFVHDFVVFPRMGLVNWLKAFEYNGTKSLISGIAQINKSFPPSQSDDISVWTDDIPPSNRFIGSPTQWIPEEWENFYCAVPRQFILEINGIDERADYNIAWVLHSMATQAKLLNYRLVVDRSLLIDMVDHREWKGEHWCHRNIRTGLPSAIKWVLSVAPPWGCRSPNPFNFTDLQDNFVRSKQI